MLMIESASSIPNRKNKAFGRASFVYPSMFSDEKGNSTLASATDGVMTRWEPNWYYWSGYLFYTSSASPGAGLLEIAIAPGTIRTILISTRETCLSPWN